MSFFQGSQGANVGDGTFVGVHGSGNNVTVVAGDKRKREGIEILVGSCLPEAMHDSGARGDLRCHPGTRKECIRKITDWGKGKWDSNSQKRAFLMIGPAGVGKSAIAQTCADNFEASGKLAASFFFYRPRGWNDPKKFIPTIVYQLTTRYPAYRDRIDAIILNDRLVLQKSIAVQLRELLIKPLQKLSDDGHSVGKDAVIIVDGLDKCSTVDAQIQIIELVTASIHAQTTPFLWAFFSRPEPPITSAFSSDLAENLSWKMCLTLLDEADRNITAYLHGGSEMVRAGIEILVGSCLPEAMHDSGARGDLGCHPGTREEYIRKITDWGKGKWDSNSQKRAFLMTGPAGVGKSAIAQTCAYNFEASGKLAASFFFIRSGGWNDPRKFIPTIVYQLATRYPAYCDCIDAIILNDRFVLQKSIEVQFRELLVKPLWKLNGGGRGVERDTVIIVDGLDECPTVDAQIQIVELITTSIHQRTTPFLWAFFSRPEPLITSTFSPNHIARLTWTLPLTLSGGADSDIEAYIRASFKTIRAQHSIPNNVAWPMEKDIRRLISQSAGLFVYPVTAMRYIGKGNSGLQERLRCVLQLDPTSTTDNPFSALDQLYILIMKQISEGVPGDTLSLLYLCCRHEPGKGLPVAYGIAASTHGYCLALSLTLAAFYTAIGSLYSVLEVTKSENGMPERLKFYHTSFIDFLSDEARSEQYFAMSQVVRQHCLKRLIRTMLNMSATDPNGQDYEDISYFTMQIFFAVVDGFDGKLEEDVLQQVSQLDWTYWKCRKDQSYFIKISNFTQKIPTDWRRKIIRPSRKGLSDIPSQILAILDPEKYKARAYIMGTGEKKALMVKDRGEPWSSYYIDDCPSN